MSTMVEETNVLREKIQELHRSAENGDADAQLELANRLRLGRGIDCNKEEAVRWLSKAAEQNNSEAIYELGRCAEDGIGMTRSEVKAAQYYQSAAQLGHAKAQYAYGMCLLGAIGCKRDLVEAEKWMKQAANQGIEKAKLQLEQIRLMLQEGKKQKEVTTPIKEPEVLEKFTPSNPTPYQMEQKQLNVEEEEPEANNAEEPLPSPYLRSATGYIALLTICGLASGFFMEPAYWSMPNMQDAVMSVNSTLLRVMVTIVGGLLGLGTGMVLKGFYRKMQEVLPMYVVVLLMPLVIFLLGGIVVSILLFLWNLLTGLVKIAMTVIGIIVGLWILGSMFG